MHGGKREGAGRKGKGPCKSYWLPIELESKIATLVNEYTASLTKEKLPLDYFKKSPPPVIPTFPILNDMQLKRFQNWLIELNNAKSKTEARKLTCNPRLCHETFIKHIHNENKYSNIDITDICELYAVD